MHVWLFLIAAKLFAASAVTGVYAGIEPAFNAMMIVLAAMNLVTAIAIASAE